MKEPTPSGIAEDSLKEVDFLNNPYLRELSTESFTKEDFLETQIQLFFTINSYAKSLAALASKIPNSIPRSIVIEVLYEEHGNGVYEEFHESKMARLFNRLGYVEEGKHQETWPEITTYNLAFYGACGFVWPFAVGAVAIILKMNYTIFHEVEQSVAKQKWIAKSDLTYFSDREEDTRVHAQDFFEIIESSWKEHYAAFSNGLKFGAYLHNRLYLDLYENRKRR